MRHAASRTLILLAFLATASGCEHYGWFDRWRTESTYESLLPHDQGARARLMRRDSLEVRRLVRLGRAQLSAADVFAHRDSIMCEMRRLGAVYPESMRGRWSALSELLTIRTRADIAAAHRVGARYADRLLISGPTASVCRTMIYDVWNDSLPSRPDTTLLAWPDPPAPVETR